MTLFLTWNNDFLEKIIISNDFDRVFSWNIHSTNSKHKIVENSKIWTIFCFFTRFFFPDSYCLREWLKINLNIYDIISCLNKNLIQHFVRYLEKEKGYDVETLSIDRVFRAYSRHFLGATITCNLVPWILKKMFSLEIVKNYNPYDIANTCND